MKCDRDFKSLGIRDMHPLQVDALMGFIAKSLRIASANDQTLKLMEDDAHELIRLLGGGGLKVEVKEH
tara:strand:+ start:388 stop:591 length:204 start_codon:yes stop_codon:yes gene_type:complete